MLRRTKWIRYECEEEFFDHVVPQLDKKPHGIKITKTKYELSHICDCNPKIKYTNDKGIEYVKPQVIHNRFEEIEYINKLIP